MKNNIIFRTLLCSILACPILSHAAPPFAEFVDPNPNPGNQFGASVVPLSTGNVVITSPFDDAGGTDAGAVYLFNGATGMLISTLTGSSANERVGGNGGIVALSNGNFVVLSPSWKNGSFTSVGAVTWGSGVTGISGVINAANSLVGTKTGDNVGNQGVTALPNGNYVVSSSFWDNGGVINAGAATWGNGVTGTSGVISSANSLVGGSASDRVGTTVTALANGNYLVISQSWNNGAATAAGAVTWGNGASGISGVVSASNSLVGSYTNDRIGTVNLLSNGNYVVRSSSWNGDSGAVVWGSGLTGVTGEVSAANGLIGKSGDRVSSLAAHVLPNGNYVVLSHLWNNGNKLSAGAATWCNGATGRTGIVDASNSLVGTEGTDGVGANITILSNGNYVLESPTWNLSRGAVTWCNGATGLVGAVSSANSLVGVNVTDKVGDRNVRKLANGNYVVSSPLWNNGAITDAGAVTWCDGSTGRSGQVTSANSLVGTTSGDQVGSFGAIALSNGNYVVSSPLWNNGAITDAGAATWGNGTTGISGAVSSSNSLVGGSAMDKVGSVSSLPNGNYVVASKDWDNGATTDAGAVTWGDGSTGITGLVGPGNSLVGSQAGDTIGVGVGSLPSGNYIVFSPSWDNGSTTNAGAVTWGNGLGGTVGPVSSANSLVGSSSGDAVGTPVLLPNGNYIVSSSAWDNGSVVDAGAVTWGSGTTGVSGIVSASNSIVGSQAGDAVGFGMSFPNGNYLMRSQNWDNGPLVNAGAVTWASGIAVSSGVISSNNSMIGQSATTGLSTLVVDNANHTFFGRFLTEGGGVVRVGSQDNGFAPSPLIVSPSLSALASAGANLGGTVTSDNGFPIIARGVVYSPTSVSNNPRLNGLGVLVVFHASNSTGSFSVPVAGLMPETAYSFSAFATNSAGTSYTLPTSTFTTPSPPGSGEIALSGNGLNIANGDVTPDAADATAYGSVAVSGGTVTRTFTITNNGTGDLALTGTAPDYVTVSGSSAFSVSMQPAAATITAGGGTHAFAITFDPSTIGSHTATVSISSNDADENPFNFTVNGEGVTAEAAANAVIAAAGLTGNDALPTATPFNDGVENLLKYAFNMNLAGSDVSSLLPGAGTSGLPSITTPNDAPDGTLRVEFIRRKGSGLTYTPQKSTTLDGPSWSSLSATPVVTSINDQWERVVYIEAPDPIPAPACFSRVQVAIP